MKNKKIVFRWTILVFWGLMWSFWGTNPLQADVNSGDVITRDNWEKVKDLIPVEFVLNEIKLGHYKMSIGENHHLKVTRGYEEATKKYAGQPKIGPDDRLLNYTGGLPFSSIDPADPQAGIKIGWNMYWRCLGDDYTWPEGGVRRITDKKGNTLLGAMVYTMLRPTGRVSVEPIPAFKGHEEYNQFRIIITTKPRDQAGTCLLVKRHIDPKKEDDQWIYLPSLRRVKRFPTSARCATMAPADWSRDNVYGFDGKTTLFTYRLLGETKTLSCKNLQKSPFYDIAPGKPGAALALLPINEKWEVRDNWIVEQVPKNPNYCLSKRIFYVDKEWPTCNWGIEFDKKGESWKELCCFGRPHTTAQGEEGIYMEDGGMIFDKQLIHSTITSYNPQATNSGLKASAFNLKTILKKVRMQR